MKKILFLVAVIVICISTIVSFSLVGCKTEIPQEEGEMTEEEIPEEEPMEETTEEEEITLEEVTITLLVHDQPPYTEIINQIGKDFMEENPNVTLNLQFVPHENVVTLAQTDIASGGEIDVFVIGNFDAPFFHENEAWAELDPIPFGKNSVEEVVNMWIDGSFGGTGVAYNDKYYGLPYDIAQYAAWINTAHMVEAGLDPVNDIPKTWSEFTDVTKKLTQYDDSGTITRNGFATNLTAGIFSFLILNSMVEQKGLDWSTEEGLMTSLDSPEFIEVLTVYTDWITKDKIWDPALFTDEREAFSNAKCSTFLTGGSWYWAVLEEGSVSSDDVVPFPYPIFEDGKDISGPLYGYGVYVSNKSDNKDWAWKWADYLLSFPDKMIPTGLYQPRKTLTKEMVEENVKCSDVFTDQLSKGSVILASSHYNEIGDTLLAAITRIVFEGVSVEDSVITLSEEVEVILQ